MDKIYPEEHIQAIANAIRRKNGKSVNYLTSEMAGAINALESYPEPTGTQTITENGIVDIKDKAYADVNVQASATLISKTITANGEYDAEDDEADGYSDVTVNVPNSYAASDEGKVVSSGALVAQTSTTKTANGTYDTTENNEVVVAVENSYTAADEGKVVDNGALVAQGSQTITQNGTYDTTLISELIANISGGGGGAKNILGGTTAPTSADGTDGDIYIKYQEIDVPSEYTPVEYLGVGDTAGPYIDTGCNFTTKSEFEVKAQYTNTPNSNSWLFGAYVSRKQTNVGYTGNAIWIQTGGSNRNRSFDTNAHVYQSTQTAFLIDGEVLTGATPNWSNTVTLSAKLFYIGDGTYSNKCRIHYCKIWDDGTLVRNLVPAKRKSDDVLGMYDLVSNTFYTNAGTGSFIAGEELTGAPIDVAYLKVDGSWIILEDGDWDDVNTEGGGGSTNILSGTDSPTSDIGSNGSIYLQYSDTGSEPVTGYTLLEWLGVANAAGPYIETGYFLTPTTEYEVDMQYTNTPNNNSWMFGSYQNDQQTDLGYTGGTVYIQVGGRNTGYSLDTDRHVYKASQTQFLRDGVAASNSPNWANTITNEARLFAINDGAGSNYCRLYNCKIWDDGVLERDFKPAKRNSDQELGMLDAVNGIFYTNSGTGSFIAGAPFGGIFATYAKVNGTWQNLIGTDIDDVNTGE